MSNQANLSYEVFEPDESSMVAPRTDTVVVMGNILGGALGYPGGLEGDHAYRAQWMANTLGVRALAYERRGTGARIFDLGAHSAVQPSQYVGHVARTAAQLSNITDRLGSNKLVICGASAAATEGIAMVRTQLIQPDMLGVFDPVGMRSTTKLKGFKDWYQHQQMETIRPETARNHNPMQATKNPWKTLGTLASIARFAPEIAAYGNTWSNDTTRNNLRTLVENSDFDNVAIHGVFVGHSFNMSPVIAARTASELQSLVGPNRTAPAVFCFEAERYHSWTDDPANFTQLANDTLDLL